MSFFKKGEIYLCVLRHIGGKIKRQELLRYVNKENHSWETIDDNSRINYDWNVVQVTEVTLGKTMKAKRGISL